MLDVLAGAPPKGPHAPQGPSAASSSRLVDTRDPEEREHSLPWVHIKDEPESQTQAGEMDVKELSDDEGKVSNVSYLLR